MKLDNKFLYHCTKKENLTDILMDGIKTDSVGFVFLAETPLDASKFLIIRGIPAEELKVIEISVDMLDSNKIDESFDHSEIFFKCRAFVYNDTIEPETFISNYLYDIRRD